MTETARPNFMHSYALGPKWRHKKRGTTYQEVGVASLQVATKGHLSEGAHLVIYRDDDGRLWAREVSEFEDGRFEKVQP